jgi:hypothetical protein
LPETAACSAAAQVTTVVEADDLLGCDEILKGARALTRAGQLRFSLAGEQIDLLA